MVGKEEFKTKTKKEFDLKDLIADIYEVISKKMVKISDFHEGDTVVGTLIPLADYEYEIAFIPSYLDPNNKVAYITCLNKK